MEQKLYTKILINIFFGFWTVICIVPFLLMVSISISNEADVIDYGYKLLPMHIDFAAYKTLFQNIGTMAWSAFFTIVVCCARTFISIVITVFMAYALSKRDFKWRGIINKLLIFTMLFNGGLIPTYILNTQYLHLNNTVWIYLIPSVTAWTVILFRTFFKQISPSLIESAKIDGATDGIILTKIVLPLTKSMVMVQAFQGIVAGWNDWQTSLYYITEPKLYTIQYQMQIYLNNATEIQRLILENPNFKGSIETIPVETLRYAMAVMATMPVLLIFPKMQKYFSKGIAVGSVKG